MPSSPSPQQAFDDELKLRLRERAQTLLATDQAVIAELQAARTSILAKLAEQPTDFEQWRLPQLLAQIELLLDGATSRMAVATDAGLRTAWQQGEDMVDKPLAAGGINVEQRLALMDVRALKALRTFTEGRIRDVGTQALAKINNNLGLVLVGAQTPFEAIKAVQTQLGTESTRRASTIVRTSVAGSHALAKQQRMEQAAAAMAETGQVLEKQWRRSGKIHSRWNHDVMDGTTVAVAKPFKVVTQDGGLIDMMHPHDPTAPAEEVINCGCMAIPRVKGWVVATPGAKPFTDLELKLDGRKAQLDQLDQLAKRRGMRQ